MSRRPGAWGVIAACGVVELVGWGALYYVVPVLQGHIAADTGWAPTSIALAYSAALVTAALLGPVVGRIVDARGPRVLVTAGAVLGAAGLLIMASSSGAAGFAVGMLLVGVAQSATLYPPVFAALAGWFGSRAVMPITVVTVFGGASSTVFAPPLTAVAEASGWRTAMAAAAAVVALVLIPFAWFGLRARWSRHGRRAGSASAPDLVATRRSRTFRALQVSMLLSGVALYAVTLNLIPLLRERGYGAAFAALAFGLVGLGQVAGRLLLVPLATLGRPRSRTVAQVVAAALTLSAVGAGAGVPAAVLVAAVAVGAVRGTHTVVMASGIADRWGTSGFGTLSGFFNRPVAIGIATAPFLGTLTADWTGSWITAAGVFAVLAGLGVLTARLT